VTVTSKPVSTAPSPSPPTAPWGKLGCGPTFQRMWDLYLAYCQARFRAGYLDVRRLLPERGW
jgi:hypothetical protein